jgi:hypothetical protein
MPLLGKYFPILHKVCIHKYPTNLLIEVGKFS